MHVWFDLRSFLACLFNDGFDCLGWAVGGDNTSAYMLVYVRECDLPKTMLDLSDSKDNVSDPVVAVDVVAVVVVFVVVMLAVVWVLSPVLVISPVTACLCCRP